MLRISYLILLCVLIFVVSCSHSDEPKITHHQTTNKTILMYLPWSGDASNNTSGTLYNDFLNNISAAKTTIKSQKGLGNSRLLIFICSAPSKAFLIEITYNNGNCHQDTIAKYSSPTLPNYTTTDGIAQILKVIKTTAPADKYSMMIGCHGSGWLPKGIDVSAGTPKPKRAFGGETALYQTNVTDLATGIAQAGIHMQFISFDDCYMAGIEVAYDLRDVTDCLIASTSEIMSAGLPYDKVLPYLLQCTPDYNGVCDAFYSFYNKYQYPYGTLSVIDCTQMGNVAALMKAVNSSLTITQTQLSNIQRLDGYASTVYYDFGDYVKHLCAADPVMYERLTNAIQQIVPYKRATRQIYSAFTNPYTTVNTFSGITISDPTLNSVAQGYIQQTSWWKATH